MKKDLDIAIIGAGLAGASTAYHLANLGYDVILLDAGKAGKGNDHMISGTLGPDKPSHSKMIITCPELGVQDFIKFEYNPRAVGLLVFVNDKDFTPTLNAMSFFNKRIKTNYAEVSQEQAQNLLLGESINLSETKKQNILSEGYIAIKIKEQTICSADYFRGVLKANLPK